MPANAKTRRRFTGYSWTDTVPFTKSIRADSERDPPGWLANQSGGKGSLTHDSSWCSLRLLLVNRR
jgi:hypothetical protein